MNGAKSDWLWIGKNPTDFKEWLWEEWLKIGGTQNDCEWEGIRMTMNRKEKNQTDFQQKWIRLTVNMKKYEKAGIIWTVSIYYKVFNLQCE